MPERSALASSHADDEPLVRIERSAAGSTSGTGLGLLLAVLADLDVGRPHLLWKPPGGPIQLGIGEALRITSPAGEPLDLPVLRGRLDREAAARGLDERPLTHLAVAFDPEHPFPADDDNPWRGFPAAALVVPEILLSCHPADAERPRLSIVAPRSDIDGTEAEVDELLVRAAERGAPTAEPTDLAVSWRGSAHRAKVIDALAALAPPELTKVVLAHAVEVMRPTPFDPVALLARLAEAHPGCFLFSLRPAPGAAVFLGASPERLARVEGRRVISGALAGSAPRGDSPAEDERLGRGLLDSGKDRQEHAIVGDMIETALAPLCQELVHRREPEVMRLANVQHLFTPLEGTLETGRDLLDVVQALHPTPAVGGMPRPAALEAIRRLEPEPRGLYAGIVGHLAPDGGGEAAVAIRSALVDGPRARVFAGGGIVATSDPDREVEETRIKLEAILAAMAPERAPEPGRCGG